MAATKAKKRKVTRANNVIVGMYPPKRRMTMRDYMKVYGLKTRDVRRIAKEIGIKPCLNGH